MEKTLISNLKDDYDLYIEDLRKFMQIASVANNKEKVIHALNYLIDLAEDFGLAAEVVCDNQIGIIEYGQGQEVCGVLCHVDVVDANSEEWQYDPFDLTIVDDIMYGRGIVDGKGVCLLILYILKHFKENNIQTKHKIRMIIGSQEEVVWNDIKQYKEEYELPNYGFTPDGFFPIQNAEKGLLDLAFEFEKENIETISAGNATNSVPSNFDIIVDGEEYHFSGQSAHSSTPSEGVNAIVEGCKTLALKHSNFLFDFVNKYLADSYGEKFDLRQDDIVNEEHNNRTTIVPTMIEDGIEQLFLSVNVRLAHSNTYDKLITKLDEIADDYQFIYQKFDYIPPINIDPQTSFVQKLANAYESVTNLTPEFIFASRTSYAKAIPNFVCFGPILVGRTDTSHSSNEQMSVADLMTIYEIYFRALYELCVK
ncbi:M20/M25/M40 family metallo-hydrolase [Erysipelotrichaceae bacterium OttesenSCG-928-M19]|nr:M20/M25/M40 family metallo-hydrolase [Erysipelotrichaceae bacterium OttesenSCG-928-M19]